VKKWQGFKAYLAEIQQVGDLAEAQEILDHYFAYAVALGVDDRLLAQIQQLGGYIPSWWSDGSAAQPMPHTRRTFRDRWRRQLRRGSWRPFPASSARPAASTSGAPRPPSTVGNGRPPLETISDGLAGGLEQASTNLAQMLNTAVGPTTEGESHRHRPARRRAKREAGLGRQQIAGWHDERHHEQSTHDTAVRPSSGGGSGGYSGSGGFGGAARAVGAAALAAAV
jgi:hypothetical protein